MNVAPKENRKDICWLKKKKKTVSEDVLQAFIQRLAYEKSG